MTIIKRKKLIFEKKAFKNHCLNIESEHILNNILFEASGIFPKQVELTHFLSDNIINMIRSSSTQSNFDISDYKPFKLITIKVEYPKEKYIFNGYTVCGELTELSDDRMVVTIKIPRFDILALHDDILRKKIEPCIAHELNHAYVALMKYFNSKTLMSISDNYSVSLTIYKSEEYQIPNEVRDFAYLIYSTNPYEIQARISQVYQELDDIIKEKPLSLNILKQALKETDTYQTFFDNAYNTSKIISEYLKTNINDIIYWFNEFGIDNLTETNIINIFNEAINESKNALKLIGKVAMEYYYRNK